MTHESSLLWAQPWPGGITHDRVINSWLSMFTFPSNQQDLEWRVIVFNVPPELDTGYFLPAIMDCSTLSSGSFHLFWAPLPCSVFSWPGSWRTKESVSCRESGANLFSIWLATHYTIRPSSVILFIAKTGKFSVKRELPKPFPIPWEVQHNLSWYGQISTLLPRGAHAVSTRSEAQLATLGHSAPWYSAQS